MSISQKLHLLFDLDDTLIHCNKYFDLVIDQFAELMSDWFRSYGIAKQEIMEKQQELDLAGIQMSGFAAERFPESFGEAYDHFSALYGRDSDPGERERLLELGYTVYDSEFELYPDVVGTLTRLQQDGHELSLFTGGDRTIQTKKVEKVNLSPFFEDRIFVATHKNSEALEQILSTMNVDRSLTWMTGNSLRTDIAPAIACNIGAVYIPPLSNWAFDLVEIPLDESDRLLRVSSIVEVPAAISAYYQQ